MITIEIRGIKRLNNFFLKLPKQMNKEIMISSEKFMQFVQKSAKLRAPRDTGKLAHSISLIKEMNEIRIVVDSPYGIFQEFGFRPHWVHSSMSDREGSTIGKRLGRRGFIFVKEFTPFIQPALEMGLSRLPLFLKMATEDAVVKSRR